jgi:hypothetical protein
MFLWLSLSQSILSEEEVLPSICIKGNKFNPEIKRPDFLTRLTGLTN